MKEVYVKRIVLSDIYCVFYVNRIVVCALQCIQDFLHDLNELMIFHNPFTVDKYDFTALSTVPEHSFSFTVMLNQNPLGVSRNHLKTLVNRNVMQADVFQIDDIKIML